MVTSGAMVRRVRIDAPDGRFLCGDGRSPQAVPRVREPLAVPCVYDWNRVLSPQHFAVGFA